MQLQPLKKTYLMQGSKGPNYPKVSILHLEFEIPKRWSNKIYAAAGSNTDPFPNMEKVLSESLPHVRGDEEVRLIGFTIND